MAYNLLKGKRGIITGALDANSIAWKVAEKAYEEGATFVLTNAPIAMRMGEINKLAEKINAPVIPCDVSAESDVQPAETDGQPHIAPLGRRGEVLVHGCASSSRSTRLRNAISAPNTAKTAVARDPR